MSDVSCMLLKTTTTKPPPKYHHTPPHNKWGIYQLTCKTCKQSYVGQTSRSLSIHFQEHTRYMRHNNPQYAYALHILQNQHEYSPIKFTMSLLKSLSNPRLLLTCEQHYIQTLQRERKLIPEQNPGETNPLFQAAINPCPLHSTRTNQ